jgi:hypothetical protein
VNLLLQLHERRVKKIIIKNNKRDDVHASIRTNKVTIYFKATAKDNIRTSVSS